MKLYVVSDLHLEFAAFDAAAHERAWRDADVIVLAGDIGKGSDGIKWGRQVFGSKPIVYVLGNHEYYGHDWVQLLTEAREVARDHDVHFLENRAVVIDGVRVLGATLWTDFDLFGTAQREGCMRASGKVMNDFRSIKSGHPPGRLTPEQSRDRHLASRAWLEGKLAAGDPDRTVVVTHHFPDRASLAAQYATNPVSAAFGSQLPAALLSRANLWIHGHTHVSCDYTVHYQADDAFRETRVVCNPRGYPLRGLKPFENGAFNPELIVEVPAASDMRRC